MPNWCSNYLGVRGPRVAEFLSNCKGFRALYTNEIDLNKSMESQYEYVDFTFNALHPVPKEVLDAGFSVGGKEGEIDGYHWQAANWGTKWDVDNPEIILDNIEDDSIDILMETAWSPPTEWVKKVGELFPDLTFDMVYQEDSMSFAGRLTVKDGQVTEDTTVYDGNSDYKEFMEEHFGQYFDDDDMDEMEDDEE